VKTAENCLALRGLDAWAVIIDADMHLLSQPRRPYADEPVRRREADRIVDNIVNRAFEPMAIAHHRRSALARAGERDARLRLLSLLGAGGARGQHRFDHESDVDRLEKGARQLRVDPARVADI